MTPHDWEFVCQIEKEVESVIMRPTTSPVRSYWIATWRCTRCNRELRKRVVKVGNALDPHRPRMLKPTVHDTKNAKIYSNCDREVVRFVQES